MFENRVVGLERLEANKLTPHPLNWRLHPEDQKSMFADVLKAIGVVGAVVVYRDGEQYVIIDGHLRQEIMGEEKVPVVVTDLTATEAELLLVTRDPLAAMAGTDDVALDALCREIHEQGDPEIASVIAEMHELVDEARQREAEEKIDPRDRGQEDSGLPKDASATVDPLRIEFRHYTIYIDQETYDAIETSIQDWIDGVGLTDGWADAMVRKMTKNRESAEVTHG